MIKFLTTAAIVIFMSAFAPASAQIAKSSGTQTKSEVKFLNDIEVGFATSTDERAAKVSGPKVVSTENQIIVKKEEPVSSFSIESANQLQLKYSILLDTEVEFVLNLNLFNLIDEWFGTRYRYGGTSKKGIDCSALMQTFFAALYGVGLPRTAREQYGFTKKIERSELKEGDLVFFNTTGGVSHVGMYLQNNKFVHSASSSGVMISDLDEAYWSKRYLSAGRYEAETSDLSIKP